MPDGQGARATLAGDELLSGGAGASESYDLILASDRGPVTLARTDAGFEQQPRPGSVTAVLDAAIRSMPHARIAWFAPSSSPGDISALQAGAFGGYRRAAGYAFEPVPVRDDEYREYYAQAGARMLWIAHHGLREETGDWAAGQSVSPPDVRAFTDAYQRVNRGVAAKIAARASPDTLVVLHDYQLSTAPSFLRLERPLQPVAHFTHTPFADPDGLARLPSEVARGVLTGMLGADLLGFQCQRWSDNFLACCEEAGYRTDRTARYVDGPDSRTWVRCYPAAADVRARIGAASGASVRDWERRLAEEPARNIVRIERLDPAKNAARGIQAFGLLLRRRPELRGAVKLIACLIPSRSEIPEYREYAQQVRAAIDDVTSMAPGSVQAYWGHDLQRALAAMRIYDVLFVSPVRDGMNLVAQEGPSVNQRNGVLVLSSGAGAAETLAEDSVVLDDPRDVPATADALYTALMMPAGERARRAGRLRARITERDPASWLREQLRDLATLSGRAHVVDMMWS